MTDPHQAAELLPIAPAIDPPTPFESAAPPQAIPETDQDAIFSYSDSVAVHIPHIGHALLFLLTAGIMLLITQGVLTVALSSLTHTKDLLATAKQPKLLVGSEVFAYLATLIASYFFFPLLWHRSFGKGIQWNLVTARRHLGKLIPFGIILGFTVQAISSLLPVPKSMPMNDFFQTPSDVWLITAFGILLAPMAEEICFRGFLLPAFAIAHDWLALRRTPVDLERWHAAPASGAADNNLAYSLPAIISASFLSSILFALLHAEQLAHAWSALFVLFCVSVVLTIIRIRTRSVACSTIVHACYNLSVFTTLFLATGGYRHLERISR